MILRLTKYLVANVVFFDEVAQELLIDTGLIDNLVPQSCVNSGTFADRFLDLQQCPRKCTPIQLPSRAQAQLPRG